MMKVHASLCLLAGVSAIATSSAGRAQTGATTTETAPSAPQAEAAPPEQEDDIVVRGIRNALRSSLATKRDATAIVEAVSAEDVGKFPDTNVSESLQRLTGVAIQRTNGEGQFITVRGLGPEFNTVLVNGRILATDNDGREFSFDVLSSNLISQAQVYKSAAPELQEGGIGATVNVVTAKPLDAKKGLQFTASAGGIYDRLSESLKPDVSGIASWTNRDKTFGLLLSGSLQERDGLLDRVNVSGWFAGPVGAINGTPDSAGLTPAALTRDGAGVRLPRNLNYIRTELETRRINAAGAVQYEPAPGLRLTLDGLFAKYDSSSINRFAAVFFDQRYLGPITADATGTATGFTRPGTAFRDANPAIFGIPGDQNVASQNDNVYEGLTRHSKTYEAGGNVAWQATSALKLELDAAYSKATRSSPRVFTVVGSEAVTSPVFSYTQDDDVPVVTDLGPNATNIDAQKAHYYANEITLVSDVAKEAHLRGSYKTEGGILKMFKFGADASEREKKRDLGSNSDVACTYCGYRLALPSSLLTPYSLGGLLPGLSGIDQAPTTVFAYDPQEVVAFLSNPALLDQYGGPGTAAAVAARDGGFFGIKINPASNLGVRERVFAGYLDAQLGGDGWSLNIGGRYVHTSTTSSGFIAPVTAIRLAGSDLLEFTYAPPQTTKVRNSYSSFLPSANLRYNPSDQVTLRLAVSKTVTRPTLTSLGVDNRYDGRLANATSSGGNPTLKPFESWNYDASAEWYLNDTSYVSLTGFYKKFDKFLESQTLPVTILGIEFQDTRIRNGQKGSIKGFEVGGQYTFDALPGALSGLGVAGNYTYVSSKVDRAQQAGVPQCGYNGLSPHSYNASGFFEQFGLEARLSYNWRSAFLVQCFSDQSQPRNRKPYGQLDFSASYSITPQVQVYLEGVNLTDTYTQEYSIYETRFLRAERFGPRFLFGARFKL